MRRSPRESPAKPPLSRAAILRAALDVLRAEGIDRVTMRRVATELDTGAASLYVYVANRDELLNQMLDAVVAEVDLNEQPDPKRWREQLVRLLTDVREAMNRYPGIARVPLANVPTGHNTVRVAEHVLALLAAGGVNERSAAWFSDVVFLYVNAAALETAIYKTREKEPEEIGREIRAAFERLSREEFPHLVSILDLLTAGTADARYVFGLKLMINGLLHTPPPDTGGT